MRIVQLLLLFSILIVLPAGAQQLVLHNQHRKNKEIRLKTEDEFSVYTVKGHWDNVIALTDSTITMDRNRKTNRDTVITRQVPVSRRHPDGLKTSKEKIWARDTTIIPVDQVLYVKRPWIRKRGWAIIPAYFIMGAVLTIPMIPVVAIVNKGRDFKNLLQFDGFLLGVAGPSMLLLSLQKTYKTGRKWELSVIK